LGEVAGTGADLAGLDLAVGVKVDVCADGVSIGFRADQMKADAAVSGLLIVAVEIGGTVIGGEEEIEIAVAIEIRDGEAAAYFGLGETAPELSGYF